MILFLAGWFAATAYWAWVASLYDKPLPPRQSENGRRTLKHWSRSGP